MSAHGPKLTSTLAPHMSAFGGKADMATKSLEIETGFIVCSYVTRNKFRNAKGNTGGASLQ